MTNKARIVLNDCRVALTLLEDETDLQKWRILWAGAVALLRAVGHVLDKVDGSNPIIKRVAKDSFLRWKTEEEHRIFTEFIDKERNILLKEYNSDVHPLEEIPMALEAVVITHFARRLFTSNLQSFKRHRAHLVKITMTTFTIVKHFNVLKYV